jgi:hypothetical protein
MSRSGYSDCDDDNWALIKWRGQVASTIRGKRGQAFLRELVDALDAMPDKRLIANDLQRFGYTPVGVVSEGVCAIGSVGLRRGVDMTALDPENPKGIAAAFGIPHQLVREIEWLNDDGAMLDDTPEKRFHRVREWARSKIKEPA